MVAVHNVVAVAATVGMLGREGDLIRKTIIPMTYYCIAAGSISFMWIFGVGLNVGTIVLTALLVALVLIAPKIRTTTDVENRKLPLAGVRPPIHRRRLPSTRSGAAGVASGDRRRHRPAPTARQGPSTPAASPHPRARGGLRFPAARPRARPL